MAFVAGLWLLLVPLWSEDLVGACSVTRNPTATTTKPHYSLLQARRRPGPATLSYIECYHIHYLHIYAMEYCDSNKSINCLFYMARSLCLPGNYREFEISFFFVYLHLIWYCIAPGDATCEMPFTLHAICLYGMNRNFMIIDSNATFSC